mmetsp:Transcript_33814/g.57323  ORF Transcript_33814/g.57323 Transcript_33814/m.57323 type:complete len:288 (-) Transcript_33814:97-960(-)
MKSACHRKISQHDSPSYLAVDASDTRFAWAFVKIKVKNHRSCRSRGNRRPRALPRSEGHCFLLLIILPLLSHWNVRPSKKFGKYSVWLLCELRRPSELHQAPGVEDCHLVEPVDVLEPVAYHDNGGLEAEDHIVDLLIRLQVDICGGLITEEQAGSVLSDERPCQSYKLSLTSREVPSPVDNQKVQLTRQPSYQFLNPGITQTPPDELVRFSLRQVIAKGAGKQNCVLINHLHLGPQTLNVHAIDVVVSEEDAPRRYRVEAGDRGKDARFSTAATATQSNFLAPSDV